MIMIKIYIIDEGNWIATALPVIPRVGEDIFAFFDGEYNNPVYKKITKIAYSLKKDEGFDEVIIHVESRDAH